MSLISEAIKKIEKERGSGPGGRMPGMSGGSKGRRSFSRPTLLALVAIVAVTTLTLYYLRPVRFRGDRGVHGEVGAVSIPKGAGDEDINAGQVESGGKEKLGGPKKGATDEAAPVGVRGDTPAVRVAGQGLSVATKDKRKVTSKRSGEEVETGDNREKGVIKQQVRGEGKSRGREKELIHFNEGVRFLDERNYLLARREFELSLEYNPENVEALCNLGATSIHLDDLKGARHYLSEALRLSPHHVRSMVNLGALEFRLGKYTSAVKSFQNALRFSKEEPTLLVNLGLSYHRMGDRENALIYLKRATELYPGFPEGWYSLGLVYYGNGELSQAKRSLEKYLSMSKIESDKNDRIKQVLESIR